MEATQAQLISLLDGKKQFTIPICQRTYSWHQKQCYQLFKSLVVIWDWRFYSRPRNSKI